MEAEKKEVLAEMQGKLVQIWAGGGAFHRQGILVGYDDMWVRMESNNEVLCFPIYSVALIKLVAQA